MVTGVLGTPVTWLAGLARRLGHHIRSPMSRLSAVTSTDLTMMASRSTPITLPCPARGMFLSLGGCCVSGGHTILPVVV